MLSAVPNLLDRVRDLAADSLPSPTLVADVAAALGVDRSTLYRVLRAEGTTPSAVVREVRLEAAARALEGGASVREAATVAGYSDSAAFGRAFRRSYDVTPSMWRPRDAP